MRTSSGDHTVVETPVPIPNTVVKHSGPMIVRALAKVGIARFYNPALGKLKVGFFCVSLVLVPSIKSADPQISSAERMVFF